MKLKLLALAALLSAGSAQAAMDNFATGNGSVVLNLRLYDTASGSPTGDQSASAAFDLGMNLNDFLNLPATPTGIWTRTWNLATGEITGTGITAPAVIGSYGSVWSGMLDKADTSGMSSVAGSVRNQIEFNVIAGDNDSTAAGGNRYLSTGDGSWDNTANNNLIGFGGMADYIAANNLLGTHSSAANGASLVDVGSGKAYFRTTGPLNLAGDSWLTNTGEDTTKKINSTQSFWLLSNSSGTDVFADANETRLGYDVNKDGDVNDAGEFGVWSINLANNTATYTTAVPIPEADSYVLLAVGLGLVGLIARRRRTTVA